MRQRLRIQGTFDLRVVPEEEAAEQRSAELQRADELEEGPIEPAERRPARAAPAPTSATVTFGDPTSATPFPVAESGDIEDAGNGPPGMVPQRTWIARGGSVTFHVAPYHQVAIYRPGIGLRDIDISPERLQDVAFGPFTITDFRIDDPRGRVQLGPPQSQSPQTWTTPAGTFEQPGRYLVICTSTPHFVFGHLYGWVAVQ